MKSQIVDGAFRRILALRRDVAPGSCPDANEFAAYLEARLNPAEVARFEEHASNCGSCQEALALSLALAEDEAVTARRQVAEPWRFVYRSSPLRFALAAVVLLTVGVLLYQATWEARLVQPESQIARREAESGMPRPELTAPQSGAPQPAKVAPTVPRESAGASRIAADKKELPASQPSQGAPVGAAAPAPAIAAGTTLPARASQAAAVTEPKAAAPKPAAVEAVAEAQKAAPAQRVDLAEKGKQAYAQADESRLQVAVSDRQRAGGQARAGNVQQMVAQAPADAAPAQAARPAPDDRVRLALQEASAAKEKAQKFGDRVFVRTTGCWVEIECTRHEDAPAQEMMRDSKEFSEMLAREPALSELPKDLPVLLFWNGANLLIR
jgi:hypothetical protein